MFEREGETFPPRLSAGRLGLHQPLEIKGHQRCIVARRSGIPLSREPELIPNPLRRGSRRDPAGLFRLLGGEQRLCVLGPKAEHRIAMSVHQIDEDVIIC